MTTTDQLAVIEARAEINQYLGKTASQDEAKDTLWLLAMVRDQRARLDKVAALAESPDQTLVKPKGDKIFYVEAHRIRAAITATEGGGMKKCLHCGEAIEWDSYWTTWEHTKRESKLTAELCDPTKGFEWSTKATPKRATA